jgi:molybdopterin synthase catalytic subunit
VFEVLISSEPLNIAALQAALPVDALHTGAVVTFSGHVRGDGITAMALEHYPGMTERSIRATMERAGRRWPVQVARVVHRVGELQPGEPIVWVAVSARHRAAAFSACEFIMDYLKAEAPLWKRERSAAGDWAWVAARGEDRRRAARWSGAAGESGDA